MSEPGFSRRIYHQAPPALQPPRRSLARGLNTLAGCLERRLRRDGRLLARPRHLVIDPTSHCPLACPLCPTGRRTLARSRGFLDPEALRPLMARLGPVLETITFTNWGEPMLHPRLPELLRLARRSPAYVGFSTTLQFLSARRAEDLIQSGIDELAVSIDGATQAVYEQYRRGGRLERVLANAARLIEIRRREGADRPRLRWQYLIHRGNEHEMDAAARRAEEMGFDSIVFGSIYVDIEGMFTRPLAERLARDGQWLPRDPGHHVYDLARRRMQVEQPGCKLPWEMAVLNWDGSVSPCCGVTDAAADFGNVFEQGWEAVWNGPRYRAARRAIAAKSLPDEPLVCAYCIRHGTVYY